MIKNPEVDYKESYNAFKSLKPEIDFDFGMPRKEVCEKHCSPFNFISNIFFEKVTNIIIF